MFSILHFPKHEIQVLIFFSQNHIDDLYNCCHQVFAKASQLHQIIPTCIASGSEMNAAAFIHIH